MTSPDPYTLNPCSTREYSPRQAQVYFRPDGITAEEIDAARTPSGGWTRQTLAEWGVPWPPPAGWRARLLA